MRPGIGWNAPCSLGDFAFITCSNLAFERLFVIAAAIYYLSRTSLLDRTQNWRPGTLWISKLFIDCSVIYNLTQEIQFLGGSNYFRFITVFQCQCIRMCGRMMHVLQYTTRHAMYTTILLLLFVFDPTCSCWKTKITSMKQFTPLHMIDAWLLAVCIHKYKNS